MITKVHTYINKPTAKGCNFVPVCLNFCHHQALKGWFCRKYCFLKHLCFLHILLFIAFSQYVCGIFANSRYLNQKRRKRPSLFIPTPSLNLFHFAEFSNTPPAHQRPLLIIADRRVMTVHLKNGTPIHVE